MRIDPYPASQAMHLAAEQLRAGRDEAIDRIIA